MKRGETILQYVLIIGLLLLGLIVMLNLQKIALFQSKQVEVDASKQLAKDLAAVIEKAEAYPSDMNTKIRIPFIREYDFSIRNGLISIDYPSEQLTVHEPFSTSNLNIMPSSFSTAGVIHIYTKDRNLLVTDHLKCDTNDTRCDSGCAALRLCDPACYTPFEHDYCNPYCVDTNGDGITDAKDFDGICDPDCYNNNRNGGYYDPDCIESKDGICDPDTDWVKDTVCDADCSPKNGVCDPDCGNDPDCGGQR